MSDFKNQQKDHYKQLANKFDAEQNRDNRNHRNKIFAISDFLDIKENEKVLEVGIGTGIHAKYLLQLNKNFYFTGVDLSADMLGEAQKKLKDFDNISLKEMDGENLDFEEGTFDKVYISGSLHHYPNPEKGISEILRVLKKGGKFCIMEPNHLFPTNFIAARRVEEEKNIRLMKVKNFKKWLSPHKDIKYKIINFAYTPPFPKFMLPFFNLADKIIKYLYPLNKVSVMLFICGQKN